MNDFYDIDMLKSTIKIQQTHISIEDHERLMQQEIDKLQEEHVSQIARLENQIKQHGISMQEKDLSRQAWLHESTTKMKSEGKQLQLN